MQPPPSDPAVPYQGQLFTTFGIDTSKQEPSFRVVSDSAKDVDNSMFSSEPVENIDALTRRIYQADIIQTVDRDQHALVDRAKDDSAVYTKPVKIQKRLYNTEMPMSRGLPPPVPIRHSKISTATTAAGVRKGKRQCQQCTYMNEATALICCMCSKSITKGAEQQELVSGGPQCELCTLVNEVGSTTCKACQNTLAKSPTYV